MGKLQSKHACKQRENPEGGTFATSALIFQKESADYSESQRIRHKQDVYGAELRDDQFLDDDCPLEENGDALRKTAKTDSTEYSVPSIDENRQEWVFALYNFDHSGKVTKEDMSSLMHTICEVVDASVKQSALSNSKTLRIKLTVTPSVSSNKRKGAFLDEPLKPATALTSHNTLHSPVEEQGQDSMAHGARSTQQRRSQLDGSNPGTSSGHGISFFRSLRGRSKFTGASGVMGKPSRLHGHHPVSWCNPTQQQSLQHSHIKQASFLQESAEMLHDVVEMWPLAELSLWRLLGRTPDCQADLTTRTCRLCLTALLTGLRDYVLRAPATYGKLLRVVDLTGLRDIEHQACPCRHTLGRWARTELLTRMCYETLVAMQAGQAAVSAFEVEVDVQLDAFVTGRNYEAVVQVLLLVKHCPLKMRCVGLRVDSLSLKNLFYLLQLANSPGLRKLEVVHNVPLEAPHLEVMLSQLKFPQLRSLTLPCQALDIRRLGPEDRGLLAELGNLMSKMVELRELYLGFSTLTGHLRQLLSPLNTPLQCIELANCSLSPVDMAYLANSLHSEFIEKLDLSGHVLLDLFPNTFRKLLHRCSATLTSLSLEECGLADDNLDLLCEALAPCRGLQELKILGNPLSTAALRHLFNMLAQGYPALRHQQ
ncbi:hypothetical protein P4O66_003586 [Electrophorus voltai]|uniref:Leucine-rich repeat-containing protein 14B n=1 Tax=Electrophorus voltai TaxID=2609070 RepID=A0AAD8ZSR9_9TELE|nr:hypothetical protein P4O66_003586 [Electrophorus voltai]